MSRILAGLHPVREALRARRPLDKVLVSKGASGPRLQEIIDLCREHSILLRFEPRLLLDRAAAGVPHQNVVAFAAAHAYAKCEDLAAGASLLVILDGVEDPHNLGAIVRTAHASGADAMLLPERRSAPLTETVERAAAGALAYLPLARIGNVSQTLEMLKRKNFWIYGIDERGSEIYSDVRYAEPAVIVLGGEGKGLHENVRRHCDLLVRIPMAGAIASLNVSVAAGVILFDWRRKRISSGGES
ncbi:MAG TPA: 23S rRNA (guanosine(2251)-2'-O)-methyltransferase RlmB [Bryobacteraceae bacterium]